MSFSYLYSALVSNLPEVHCRLHFNSINNWFLHCSVQDTHRSSWLPFIFQFEEVQAVFTPIRISPPFGFTWSWLSVTFLFLWKYLSSSLHFRSNCLPFSSGYTILTFSEKHIVHPDFRSPSYLTKIQFAFELFLFELGSRFKSTWSWSSVTF